MRDLQAKSLVSKDSISRLERGEGDAQRRTLRDLRTAFEAAVRTASCSGATIGISSTGRSGTPRLLLLLM